MQHLQNQRSLQPVGRQAHRFLITIRLAAIAGPSEPRARCESDIVATESAQQKTLPVKTLFRLPIAIIAANFAACDSRPGAKLSENKTIALRSEAQLWNKGNLAVADKLYSPDFVCPFIAGRGWKGFPGIKGAVQRHRIPFPDWTESVDDIVVEGDRVVIHTDHVDSNTRG